MTEKVSRASRPSSYPYKPPSIRGFAATQGEGWVVGGRKSPSSRVGAKRRIEGHKPPSIGAYKERLTGGRPGRRQSERRPAGAGVHLSHRPSWSPQRLPPVVMPGLVPGIHVSRQGDTSGDGRGGGPTWMPGTSPGMTEKVSRASRPSSYPYKRPSIRGGACPERSRGAATQGEGWVAGGQKSPSSRVGAKRRIESLIPSRREAPYREPALSLSKGTPRRRGSIQDG